MLKNLVVTVTTATALACASMTAMAAFTSITVFGDSLSDGGNDFIYTAGNFPPAPYAQRFTNGPTGVEVMAANFGLPLTPSLAGGSNYAYGGALTGTRNYLAVYPAVPPLINLVFSGPPNFPPTGMLSQVQSFGGSFGPQSLVVLWAGPNDLFEALTLGLDPTGIIMPAMANYVQSVALLYAAGARTILMPNMPDIGTIPFGLASGNAPALTAISLAFDFFLNQTIDQLDLAFPDLNLIKFNTFGALDSLIANASAFGITNVSDPCFNEVAQTLCANPNEYIFWDTVHPTARTHQILGDLFTTAVPEPATLALLVFGLTGVGFSRRRATNG